MLSKKKRTRNLKIDIFYIKNSLHILFSTTEINIFLPCSFFHLTDTLQVCLHLVNHGSNVYLNFNSKNTIFLISKIRSDYSANKNRTTFTVVILD